MSFYKYVHLCNCYNSKNVGNSYHSGKFPHVLWYSILFHNFLPWKSLIWFLSLQFNLLKNFYIIESTYLLYLVSFTCFWESSMLWHMSVANFFWLLNVFHSMLNVFHSMSSVMDISVISVFWQIWIKLPQTFTYRCFYFSGKNLGGGFLGCYGKISGVELLMDL